jgi:hypothetical protein
MKPEAVDANPVTEASGQKLPTLDLADVTAAVAYNRYPNTLFPPLDTMPDEQEFTRAEELITEAIVLRPTEARFYAIEAFIAFRIFFVKRRWPCGPPPSSDLENALKRCDSAIGKALEIVAPVPPETKGHVYSTLLLKEGSEWEPIDPALTAEMLSLRAHCRLALYKQYSERNGEELAAVSAEAEELREQSALDLQAALALDPAIPQGGMQPGQTIEALGFRWPLPEDATSDVKAQKHDFEKLHFKKPTYCDSCLEFVTLSENVRGGGYRCKNCRFECHAQCQGMRRSSHATKRRSRPRRATTTS